MVIWLVGLSGAGKTTIAEEIFRLWRKSTPAVVKVDGDIIRALTGRDSTNGDYSVEGRRKNAETILNLCLWLDQQNINVICSILCIFKDILAHNRNAFSKYYEVFLDAPLDLVIQRDTKGLYAPANSGETENVVGVDIEFPVPETPDLIVKNTFEDDIRSMADHILTSALKG